MVKAGSLDIGGSAPVSIQTMTKLPIEDVDGSISQVKRAQSQGADLVRLAVKTEDSVQSLERILKMTDTPLCADIHFNYKIALAAIKAGIHKVRINPGNIGSETRVREVVKAAKDNGIPIRIGVNGGSVDRKKYPDATPADLVESAMEHVHILEDNNFEDIVVSIKSSSLEDTIAANKIMSERRNYALHVGLTEAGYGTTCLIQSSIAIGHLLLSGIGDTIRVSMTGDPVDEIIAGRKILESIGERVPAVRIVSCPTCGRTDPAVNMRDIAEEIDIRCTELFEDELKKQGRSITLAVMGCEVNGPGEAAHADAGIAGGSGGIFLLFAGGKIIKKVEKDSAVNSLIEQIERLIM